MDRFEGVKESSKVNVLHEVQQSQEAHHVNIMVLSLSRLASLYVHWKAYKDIILLKKRGGDSNQA